MRRIYYILGSKGQHKLRIHHESLPQVSEMLLCADGALIVHGLFVPHEVSWEASHPEDLYTRVTWHARLKCLWTSFFRGWKRKVVLTSSLLSQNVSFTTHSTVIPEKYKVLRGVNWVSPRKPKEQFWSILQSWRKILASTNCNICWTQG